MQSGNANVIEDRAREVGRNSTVAQCVLDQSHKPVPEPGPEEEPQYFIVTTDEAILERDTIPPNAKVSVQVKDPIPPGFGELRFAVDVSDGYALLGHYEAARGCFTELSGWVSLSSVVGRNAIKVSDLAERYGAQVRALKAQAKKQGRDLEFSPDNPVLLRVLLRPEQLARARLRPAERAPIRVGVGMGDMFFWRYVYDMRESAGTFWFLIGTHAHLAEKGLSGTRIVADIGNVKLRLQGWVRAEDVVPWTTNIVLEFNAARDAVEERMGENGKSERNPNLILKKLPPHKAGDERRPLKEIAEREQIEIVAREDAGFWRKAFEDTATNDDAKFLPHGTGRAGSRLHVSGRIEGRKGWRVGATLGSTGSEFRTNEWVKASIALHEVLDRLAQLDIVFVVDMSREHAYRDRGNQRDAESDK